MDNLLSIPFLDQEGYHIKYNSDEEWVVKTPQGVITPFKRDTWANKRMPYIDTRECKEGFGMIDTVRENFWGFTKEEILKAELYRNTQSMVGNPPAV